MGRSVPLPRCEVQNQANQPIYTYAMVALISPCPSDLTGGSIRPPAHPHRPWCILVVLLLVTTGCGMRSIRPIRYVPLLGKEPTTTTTDVLVRALRDQDVTVRAQAVELLGLLAQTLDNSTKRRVAAVLGMALLDRDPGLRLQVVECLGAMEATYTNKYLIGALKDPNPFVRAKVLVVIGDRERREAEPPAQPPQSAEVPTGG